MDRDRDADTVGSPRREYAPLRDYGAIGDGRTAALVARNGSIDWLCLPDLDSPSVFAGILDRNRGGHFALEPEAPYEVTRQYVPGTNVLETTFTTADGATRVTDAMTLPADDLAPERELVRRVEGLSGRVPMRWRVEPRFSYGARSPRIERRGEIPVATVGGEALAVCHWSAGRPDYGRDSVSGRFEVSMGDQALIAIASAHGAPLVLAGRSQVERRLADTERFWRTWSAGRAYDGPWREAVLRSALALKLLCSRPRERLPPPLRPRCPSRSVGSATGTIAIPGCGTRPLPSRRFSGSAVRQRPRVLLVAHACLSAHTSETARLVPAERRRFR